MPKVDPAVYAQEEARRWIERYCDSMGIEYEDLMDHAAVRVLDRWHYWNEGDRFEGEYLPDEFWDHYETITGKRGEGSFFTCSC